MEDSLTPKSNQSVDANSPKCPRGSPTNSTQTNKHVCDICNDSFKNNFLLTRHVASHKHNISCKICKKVFENQSQLAGHERTHVKDQTFKATASTKDSPTIEHRCGLCDKAFSMQSLLNAHVKQHKFACKVCKQSFASKYLLDGHVLDNCVDARKRTVQNKRDTRVTATNIKWDVNEHGLKILEGTFTHESPKHRLHVPQEAHAGVPPSPRLRAAFKALQSKLNNL